MNTAGGTPLPSWVFNRDGDTIAIRRVPPLSLLVESSERHQRDFSFLTIDELTAFQCGFEAHLLDTGWSLVDFGPERRHPDPPGYTRRWPDVDRRRYPWSHLWRWRRAPEADG